MLLLFSTARSVLSFRAVQLATLVRMSSGVFQFEVRAVATASWGKAYCLDACDFESVLPVNMCDEQMRDTSTISPGLYELLPAIVATLKY
jgi:hypothetical protein